MAAELEHPWFPEVIELLDLRRRDRVLVVTAQHPRFVEVLESLVTEAQSARIGHALDSLA